MTRFGLPGFVKNLARTALEHTPSEEMVVALREENAGRDLPFPVRLKATLEKTGFPEFCHIPDHHLYNSEDDPDWIVDTGIDRYNGVDMEIDTGVGALSVRMLYNWGDGDCNDGFWGAVWRLDSGEKLAWFESTGDCETTIVATAEALRDFSELSFEIPAEDDVSEMTWPYVLCEHGHQLERLIRLGLLMEARRCGVST